MRFCKLLIPLSLFFLLLSSFSMQPDADSYLLSGRKYCDEKNFIKGIGDFTMAISLRPDFGIAYLERAKAKLHFAEKMGFANTEYCFDLVQALQFGQTEAVSLLDGGCDAECFGLQQAFIEPDIVFCADFSSKVLSDLPKGSGELTNLVKLNMFNNRLSELSPDFRKLKSLVILDLSSNKIEELDATIGTLKNLKELNLNKNEITSIPTEIGELKIVQKLFLRSNQINSIPASIGNCQELEVIDLSLNKLTNLPAEIGQLKKLKVLNLVGNSFEKKTQKKITSLLPQVQVYF